MQSSSPTNSKKRRNILFRVARNSLFVLTPLIWLAGVYGAFFHGNVVIMNRRIDDVPSFVFCVLVAPLEAVVCGFVIWLLFIGPFQLMFWIWDRSVDLLGRLFRLLFPPRKSFLDPRRA